MASLKGLQKRYDRCLQEDDYYGAEQACRMMHHRLTQSKEPSSEQLNQALEILLNASRTLLSKGQIQAGTALALLITKHYVDYEVPVDTEHVDQLLSLEKAYGTSTLTDEGRRELLRFLKSSLAWSTKESLAGFRYGHPRINTSAAHAAAQVGDYENAQRFFLRSDDPNGAAEALFKYAKEETLTSEVPLVLTRVVLAYLVAENIKDAKTFRTKFAQLASWRSVADGQSSTSSSTPPLANFCELLIKICQLDSSAANLFKKACNSYEPELSRDEKFAKQLSKIGQIYFSIQPSQPSGLAGMMGSMLRGMMNS